MKKRDTTGCGLSCGVVAVVLALNATVGGLCLHYLLDFWFGKDIPWYADAIAGTFLGEITFPAMIVTWVLSLCGVHSPVAG